MSLASDGAHYVEIHSALDRPPQAELHAADGALIAVLSSADVSGLQALGWIAPEPFRAKAADGETDISGVLFKPYDFDPARKYPVIEQIYAGPQSMLAPHAFGTVPAAAFAQLGYILVIVDARGTPGRGKAFQDVAVGRMGDYEIADHAGALRQAAATRPYMDLSRVGIFGGSYGGYFTIRALIQAPDLYRAAVSLAPAELGPCVMGPPVECYAGLPGDHPEHYERLRNTDKLGAVRGDLLIISAADDVNTPLEHTMLYAEALVRLKTPFDQVVMPGCNHVLMNARGEPQLEFMYAAMLRHFARTLHPGT
jgi:dipeptidyl aminopeptidase/acylaminoacyl peptidase